jgi:probable rRNA maturation factor
MTDTLTIKNTTKGKHPSLPFLLMKNKILGKDYELSLVFIGSKRSRALNSAYRQKDKAADILSFPLSKSEGEIFIDLGAAKKRAAVFEEKYRNFIGFLFIHGLLHLKGFDHGSTMEHEEKKFRTLFRI